MVTKFEPSYVTTKLNRNIFTVRCTPKGNLKDWEQWFLLTSDRHWDNPKSNWELQVEHLKEARKRNAGVIDCGDFFCAMQGKYDPRSSKSDLRPEHQGSDYLDALVNTASDFFIPYADQFIVIGRGNHEANILKRHETDLIGRMTEQIKYRSGHKIHSGGYGGFVRFAVQQKKTTKWLQFGKGLVLHYSHGYGGGGPVTKGVIQTNRKATYLPDADIVISGHIHEAWKLDLVRLRLGRNMTYHDVQTHVCVPTYKEEFKDGYGGWHVERGAPPKPIGATWLRLFYKYEKSDRTKGIDYEIIQAR